MKLLQALQALHRAIPVWIRGFIDFLPHMIDRLINMLRIRDSGKMTMANGATITFKQTDHEAGIGLGEHAKLFDTMPLNTAPEEEMQEARKHGELVVGQDLGQDGGTVLTCYKYKGKLYIYNEGDINA